MPIHDEMVLISVNYLPEKRGVVVEFASPSRKASKFFSFFPSFYLPLQNIQKEALKELLQLVEGKRTRFQDAGSHIQLTASTFSDLKKIANLIHASLHCFPLLIEPERQFLLSMNWSYFDSFSISESDCTKLPSKYSDAKTDYLADSLHQTLSQLQKISPEQFEEFSDFMIASNVLKVPVQRIPDSIHQCTELFLENLYFSQGNSPNSLFHQHSSAQPFYAALQSADLPKKILSHALNSKLIFGPDTLNCACCTPKSLSSSNILPSSLVKVQFLSDGMYFESALFPWAQAFHHSHPLQQNRISRYQEFRLNTIPVGPFKRNHMEFVPLPDAIQLESEKLATILDEKQLQWFCTQKKSFLLRELSHHHLENQSIQNQITSIQASAYSTHQLMAVSLLSQHLPFQLYSKHCQFLQSLFKGVFQHYLNPASKFYSPEFANGLVSMVLR